MKRNEVVLSGTLLITDSGLFMRVARKSGALDTLPIRMSDTVFGMWADKKQLLHEQKVTIYGHMGSENLANGKVAVFVIARNLVCYPDGGYPGDTNEVYLRMVLTRPAILRRTKQSDQAVAEVLGVVKSGRKDAYVNLVFWNQDALTAAEKEPGTYAWVRARFQSRMYKKPLSDGQVVEGCAYELAVKGGIWDE